MERAAKKGVVERKMLNAVFLIAILTTASQNQFHGAQLWGYVR